MENIERLYSYLKKINIPFTVLKHPPVNSVEESEKYMADILEGARCRNLFLRNQKGDKHFLVILGFSQSADLKNLAQYLNEKRLGFASEERLHKYLGLMPGCVSIFGLINDSDNEVIVIMDKSLKQFNKISFHANVNTETLTISYVDFEKFIDSTGNKYMYIDV